jgi:hypothetical protein
MNSNSNLISDPAILDIPKKEPIKKKRRTLKLGKKKEGANRFAVKTDSALGILGGLSINNTLGDTSSAQPM